MRLIFMRHGESSNNIAAVNAQNSNSTYEELRTFDPEISGLGEAACRKMGEQIKGMGVTKIFCSAQKRAVVSAKCLREGMGQEIPIELLLNSHELYGVYKGEKIIDGLTKKQILEICPDILNDLEDEDLPWNHNTKSLENK